MRNDTTGSQRLSRRGFLAGLGAGAVSAVALRPQGAAAAIVNKTFTQATQPGIRFGRIFNLPPFAPATSQVRAALMDIGKPGGLLDAKDDLSQGPVLLITDPSLSVNNQDNPT